MTDHHERVGLFQISLLLLSMYVLVALAAEVVFTLSTEAKHTLHMVDTAICVVFLADFLLCFHRAPSKLRFLRWGWIDLISSIPALHVLRWGRLFRVVRILRSFRAVHILLTFLYAKRARGAFATVVITCAILVAFASVTILHVETAPESNIKNIGDALWWAAVTITTVGYGDKFPVTAEGRLLAVLLMTAGVALFGIFTGFIASWFAEHEITKTESSLANVQEELAAIKFELSQMREELRSSLPQNVDGNVRLTR